MTLKWYCLNKLCSVSKDWKLKREKEHNRPILCFDTQIELNIVTLMISFISIVHSQYHCQWPFNAMLWIVLIVSLTQWYDMNDILKCKWKLK